MARTTASCKAIVRADGRLTDARKKKCQPFIVRAPPEVWSTLTLSPKGRGDKAAQNAGTSGRGESSAGKVAGAVAGALTGNVWGLSMTKLGSGLAGVVNTARRPRTSTATIRNSFPDNTGNFKNESPSPVNVFKVREETS